MTTDDRTVRSINNLTLALLGSILHELRDAAVAFQGQTETPAEAGQRATRLREAVDLATSALDIFDRRNRDER